MEGLSSVNRFYTQNINRQNPPVPSVLAQTNPENNDDKNKRLKKALIGLGIAGTLVAAGVGIYCISRGRTHIEPPKAPKNTNPKTPTPKKITPKQAPKPQKAPKAKQAPPQAQAPKTSNPPNPPIPITSGKKPTIDIKSLGNNRIQVSYVVGNTTKSFEMPEYLYHITSKEAMDSIVSSGTLNISRNEQLPGLFLLDSENFLTRYGQTKVGSKVQDKLSKIFMQADKNNPKDFNKQFGELVVIKIPTADLLKTEGGKFRVRTQEDFFGLQERLAEIAKKAGITEPLPLRSLYDVEKREDFKKAVLSKGVMDKASLDSFMREMTIKIHHGKKLEEVSRLGLSGTHSLEYIFNKPVKLADYPNIRIQRINPNDYIKAGTSDTIDPNKAKSIFDGTFSPLIWPMAA